ncbi:type VI secretion system-associated protein TagF [Roseibium sp. Sym1]|uniref:type VI secretion system-associated protein TagF n=1 Tax=Roseibium sp. Sym1 TaxID=3016006 RepID=UPI0022B5472F|nr:type VI secretion system-associated protein TagF [Roseibium sp. Sym1]
MASHPGGYFGKRPHERDFVFDGLTAGMTDAWAGLISDWVTSIRNDLPQTWQQLYFEAPAWRFAIEPGLFGQSGWCGLLSASADALGRCFPLTVLIPLEETVHHLVFRAAVEITLDALEMQTMAFIEGHLSREDFNDVIAEQASLLARVPEGAGAHKPMQLDPDAMALRISFARTDGEAIIADDPLVCAATQVPAPEVPLSYWWQDGGATRPPELCIWRGLPKGRETGGFFTGEWERFGWRRGRIDPDLILRP